MSSKADTLWDKIWRDGNGDVIIWQTPNAYLIGWAVLTIISLFLNGSLSNVFVWLGTISLIIWSLLELSKGVNYFRRALGAVVLVLIVFLVIHIA